MVMLTPVNWLSEMSNNSSFVLVSSPQNVPENWLVLKFLHSEWKGKPSLNSLSCHTNEKNHLLINDGSKCNWNNLSNLLKHLRLIAYRFLYQFVTNISHIFHYRYSTLSNFAHYSLSVVTTCLWNKEKSDVAWK